MSTFVIAEAGSTHDNELSRAHKLIRAAATAGADACKFQFWSDPYKLAERRNAIEYRGVYLKYTLPLSWLADLKIECETWGIEFMTTCYLPEDIATIAPFVKRFKVASFEASDEEFVMAHGKYGKPLIISTGMSQSAYYYPKINARVDYLHCVSAYPCPLDQANLSALQEAKYQTGRLLHGYSDHTHNVLTGALAVAAGAKILEVHFRLDDTDPANPDYATALSPGQLKDYIALVRQAEVMMGDGLKRPQKAEEAMMKYRVRNA